MSTKLAGIAFGRPSSLAKSAAAPSFGKTFRSLQPKLHSGAFRMLWGITPAQAIWPGLGLSPLISGIAGLFGLGKRKQLPPLQLFQLPTPYRRPFIYTSSTTQAATRRFKSSIHLQTPNSSPMLDHSNEIAKAVKKAILNSHSLNDVIAEL